jgi:hypothetical protein
MTNYKETIRDLRDLALKQAETQAAWEAWQMQQTPSDWDERIASIARGRLLHEAHLRASHALDTAMQTLAPDELTIIANGCVNREETK